MSPLDTGMNLSTSKIECLASYKKPDLAVRKKFGMFFTEDALCKKVSDIAAPFIKNVSRVIDPACGTGNLLLKVPESLSKAYENSNEIWKLSVVGYDVFKGLSGIAKDRLEKNMSRDIAENVSLHFFSECFLGSNQKFLKNDLVLTNPPYGPTTVSPKTKWASGRVDKSAVFIDSIIGKSEAGTNIIAILPDSLRSGPRYKKWRDFVSSKSAMIKIYPWGRFSQEADIDVFIAHFQIGEENSNTDFWNTKKNHSKEKTIDSIADVKVGNIVPYRHDHKGPWVKYIDCKDAIPWAEIKPSRSIRTLHKTFKPPFIVIRRTSSPTDKKRLVATLIRGSQPVAVENHLIVVTPKDGRLSTCQGLIKLLGNDNADNLVNQNNRCRHLTIGNIKEIFTDD